MKSGVNWYIYIMSLIGNITQLGQSNSVRVKAKITGPSRPKEVRGSENMHRFEPCIKNLLKFRSAEIC